MASVEKISAIPVIPPPDKYVLTLSETEARALLAICAKIGGDPQSFRGIFSDSSNSIGTVLGKALNSDGVREWRKVCDKYNIDRYATNGIYVDVKGLDSI